MPSRKGDHTDWVLKLAPPGNCSLGISSNEAITRDGSFSQERDNEDRAIMCFHNEKQLFMILDGHEGSKAVKFVHTHLPHLLLRSDFSGDDRSIMKVISSVILSTETEFFVSIDPYITRKVTLQIEIEHDVPDMNSSGAASLFPAQIKEIDRLDDLIKSGTTVVLALILYNRLFVANLGDSRALLCLQQPGRDGNLIVKQLTVDHNTKNDDELRRLEKCGLNPSALRNNGRLGTQQNTRSIGDYSIKGGYTNVDILKHATSEPGTAEPFIHEPIDVSACQGFLVLMSDGLYKAYEEWSKRPEFINEDLAHLVANELKNCRGEDESLVAQKVVEKVKHLFRDTHKRARTPGRLDDVTLIVKRFGLSHSQSMVGSAQPQYHSSVSSSVPQTAPPGTDKVFDFNGRPVSASIQPSLPPTSYPAQPPQTSHHQQLPPASYHHHQPPPSSQPPLSSYPSSGPENRRSRGNYDDYGGYQGGGGGGGGGVGGGYSGQHGMQPGGGAADYPYSRQQAVGVTAAAAGGGGGDFPYSRQPGMQPRADNNDYYPKDAQFRDEYWHGTQQRGNDIRPLSNVPISRVASVPPDQSSRMVQYPEASGPGKPHFYSPQGNFPPGSEQGRGFTFQSTAGQGPQSFQGGAYGHRQDPNNRQPDGRFQEGYGGQSVMDSRYPPQGQILPQQQQFVRATNTGQPFQGDPYQSRAHGSNYIPGGAPQQSYQQEEWSGHGPVTSQDASYQAGGGGGGGFRRSSEDTPDVATPVATPSQYFTIRQQSSSSFASDTSSSSTDLTLVRPPSMAAVDEADSLRDEDMVANCREPDGAKAEESPSEGPGTQDSEGQHAVMYLTDEEEEEEESGGMDDKPDSDGNIKPYVKFGDRFPTDLSWFKIPLGGGN